MGRSRAKNMRDVQADSETGVAPQNSYPRYLVRSDAEFMPRHREKADIGDVRQYSHLHGLMPRPGFFAGTNNGCRSISKPCWL